MASFLQALRQAVMYVLKWLALSVPLAVLAGSLVALFLYLLDAATVLRWQNAWLIFLLPLAGLGIHFLYKQWGQDSEKGNNLIIDEIHQPGGGVPARMTPLVLISTLITHLFGGSAGREGTAVQMGGSMAAFISRHMRLANEDRRILLSMGIAAGFGAVFGTPIAGAVFAIEVLIVGRLQYKLLIPCLIAAFMADLVCSGWGIAHTHYTILSSKHNHFLFHLDLLLLLKIVLCGAVFGGASYLFSKATHDVKDLSNRWLPRRTWLIPVIGGIIILGLSFIPGAEDYIGLGVNAKNPNGVSIVNAFHVGGADDFSWLWKLLFTAITLGTGFKGGEVTPLFFIGATLGNTLSNLLGAPVDLLAGLGFIAVFAGATKTPVACAIMGLELFGPEYFLYFIFCCYVAYYCSGKVGIYSAQRRS